jgi:hypothetical protein
MTMTGPGKKNSRVVIFRAKGYPRTVESIGQIDGVKHFIVVHRGMGRRDFLAASRIPPWARRGKRKAA